MLVPQFLPSFNTEKAHQLSFHPSKTFFVTNGFAPRGTLNGISLRVLRSDHVALIKAKFVAKGLSFLVLVLAGFTPWFSNHLKQRNPDIKPNDRRTCRVCGIPVPQESRTSRRGVHRKNSHLPRWAWLSGMVKEGFFFTGRAGRGGPWWARASGFCWGRTWSLVRHLPVVLSYKSNNGIEGYASKHFTWHNFVC